MSLELYRKLQNIVRRAFVDRAGIKPSLAHIGDSIAPDVENMQPQGLHFVAPAGAQGALLAPSAITSSAFVVGLGGDVPTNTVAAGEGGLHYMGTFKLFLKADGTIALGAYAPSDWIALASKVDSELTSVKTDLTSLKTILASHTHAGVTAGVGVTGPSANFASYTPHNPASVASTKVRAE
jgi:hypothetical protein